MLSSIVLRSNKPRTDVKKISIKIILNIEIIYYNQIDHHDY